MLEVGGRGAALSVGGEGTALSMLDFHLMEWHCGLPAWWLAGYQGRCGAPAAWGMGFTWVV